MTPAIFGISNDGLNLVVNLFILMLVVVWLALIVFTYLDARRRVSDPFLVACATIASFIPYIGTAVYAILRPPEFLEDAHERELEIKAAELRVRQLEESSCPQCGFPIERTYLRCPSASAASRTPAPAAASPSIHAGPCAPIARPRSRSRERASKRSTSPETAARRAAEKSPRRERAAAGASQGPPSKQRTQRSPEREPDPDPRQA